ncbi:ATP/GTP-binding protein [Streptomyces sp. NBC_01483]|uniref:ATP/GTP-binding protein n=1 Tax=Streptomyces sp. NBC_01483 TaxID=2903883 RepID=UPI002E2FC60A|nr:ATP/GTP-binding protein [Streptomyces sp. NBC_01483]
MSEGSSSSLGDRVAAGWARAESVVTKVLLLVIFLIGLVAQFVKPVGDALEGKAYLGGALLSLVGYVLYTEVQRLNTAHGVQQGDTDSLGATLRQLTEEVGHLNAERLSRKVALVTPRDLEKEFEKALQVGGDVRFSAMGFTGETFAKALDAIFEQSPQNDQRVVHVKVLVPDFTRPMEVPGLIGADGKSVDAPVFRRSLVRQIESYDALLKRQIGRMRHKHQGVLTVEFRVMHMSPSLKLYLINNDQVFEGIYDKIALRPGEYDAAVPAEEASGAAGGEILDLLGYDSLLTRWSADDDERARDVVVRRRKFFDTLWEAAHELSVVSGRDAAQAS